MRRPVRRLAALVSSVLLLQLVLVGSGFACALSMPMDHGAEVAGTWTTMPDMPGMSAPVMEGAQSPSAMPPAHDAPCRLPWAPAGCHSTAPCAPTVVAQTAVAVVPRHADGYTIARLVVLAPPSRSTPPELPPPRA